MKRSIRHIGAVWLALGGMAALGCSGRSTSKGWPASQDGNVQIALLAATPSGMHYHLTNAVFFIANTTTGFSTTASGDGDTLLVDLPPSTYPFDYYVYLQDGWTLNQVAADGTEHPVPATVVATFQYFTIKPQRTTPVTFQFELGSEVATTGDGSASIGIQVRDDLIDDFEDGDGQIAKLGGRNGAWFVFNDGTGTETPSSAPVLPQVLDASANYLLHVTGSGFASSDAMLPDGGAAFGAGVGANLLQDASGHPLPYNASAYGGIGFNFTLAFPADTPVVLSFLVATTATTPVAEGGTCTSGCYDDFGIVGPVPYQPGGYTFYGSFPWTALSQQGFGTPATFDPNEILNIKWIVSFQDGGQPVAANAFDFQLDNVTFTPGGFAVPSADGGGVPADAGVTPRTKTPF